MDDLISRQAAIDELCDNCDNAKAVCAHFPCKQYIAIEHLPAAETRSGKWIGIDDEPCEVWECDKCGHIVECDATLALPNYCENCGARMEESE